MQTGYSLLIAPIALVAGLGLCTGVAAQEPAPASPRPYLGSEPERVKKFPCISRLPGGGPCSYPLLMGTVTCPRCGRKPVWRKANPAVAVRFTCPNVKCGKPPKPGWKSCAYCGSSLAGRLLVSTPGVDAVVTVNGKAKGRSNAEIKGLAFGTYQVGVSAVGYQEQRKTLSIHPGRLERVSAALVSLPGKLRVVCNAPGTQIFVDGRERPGPELSLAPGVYSVRVTAPGHLASLRTVTIARGTSQIAEFSLEAIPGGLMVRSGGVPAQVFLDNRRVGTTPVTLREVAPGPHQIRLQAEGHIPSERSIQVSSGSVQTVDVILQPLAGRYDQYLASANELLKEDRFTEALTTAQDAIKLDPARYQAYFFAAKATYRRDLLDQAEKYARDAQARAPKEGDPDLLRLLAEIPKKREFNALVKAGDLAVASGLPAKAARQYADAWTLLPARGDVGIKAAQLWKESGDIAECAAILRSMAAARPEPAVGAEVDRLLEQLGPALLERFNFLMAQGLTHLKAGEYPDASRTFVQAQEVLPDRYEPSVYRAMLFVDAEKKDDSVKRAHTEIAVKELQRAITQGKLTIDQFVGSDATSFVSTEKLTEFFNSQMFRAMLQDAYGFSAQARVNSILVDRPTAQVQRRTDAALGLYWDGTAPKEALQHLRELLRREKSLAGVALGPDGSWLIARKKDGFLAGNLRPGAQEFLKKWRETGESCNAVSIGPNGDYVMIIDANRFRGACSTTLASRLRELARSRTVVTGVALGPGSTWVIAKGKEGFEAEGITPAAKERLDLWRENGPELRQVVLTSTDSFLAVAGPNGSRNRGMPPALIEQIRDAKRDKKSIRAVAVSPDGAWILVATEK